MVNSTGTFDAAHSTSHRLMTLETTSEMEDFSDDLDKSRSSRGGRGQPELADPGDCPPPPRRQSSKTVIDQKIAHDVEQRSRQAKSSVRTTITSLEHDAGTKMDDAPAPPDLEVGRYIDSTSAPGAIAVNSERQRRRSSEIDIDDFTVMTNTPMLSMMNRTAASETRQDQHSYETRQDQPSYQSSLTPQTTPIIATVVEDGSGDTHNTMDSKNVPCRRLMLDCRVLTLLFISVCIIIGVVLGLTLSKGGPDKDQVEQNVIMGPNSDPTSTPTADPTSAPTGIALEQFLSSVSFDGGAALRNETSPQRRALRTLQQISEPFNSIGEFVVKQKYASQVLRYSIIDTSGVDIVNPMNNASLGSEELEECTWPYLACNSFGQVITIEIVRLNLAFTIPEELAFFSQLEKLDIPGNNAEGTLPSTLGKLSRLVEMDIATNRFSGTIPNEIGSMAALRSLYAYDCKFRGIIPTELGLSSTLRVLDLSSNQLTGSIPSGIFFGRQLSSLHLEDNLLQGFIPNAIGSNGNMKEISIHTNELSGTLPSSMGLLTRLEALDVSTNTLNGTIPTEIEKLTMLRDFDLSENKFTGQFPMGITLLPQLSGRFSVYKNGFNATIPTEFGRLRQLVGLTLGHNDLTGTIPTELGLLTNLVDLDLHDNALVGTIPSELGKLTSIGSLLLYSNSNLTGTIPEELGNLTRIATIKVYETGVNGSVPDGLCLLKTGGNLTTLSVSCVVQCSCCNGFCA